MIKVCQNGYVELLGVGERHLLLPLSTVRATDKTHTEAHVRECTTTSVYLRACTQHTVSVLAL